MRNVLAVLLSLFVAFVAAAALGDDAVAGRTHVLVGAMNGSWVPLEGGPSKPLYSGGGGALSVATDGERFLVTDGPYIALFEEGEALPLKTSRIDPLGSTRPGFATWDGNRYLVAWTNTSGEVHVAALNREGDVITTSSLDGVFEVSGLMVNGDQVLLLEQRNLPAVYPTVRRLRAILLNADLSTKKVILLGEIPELFMHHHVSFQTEGSVIPFGDGFYVAWHQGEQFWSAATENSKVVGTRITADGTALDLREHFQDGLRTLEGRPLLNGVAEAFDTDLVDANGYVVAVIKRENREAKAPLTGTFVAHDGLILGARQLAEVELHDNRRTQLETLRLRDGRIVAVSLVDHEAELIPLDITAPRLPRRRAVR